MICIAPFTSESHISIPQVQESLSLHVHSLIPLAQSWDSKKSKICIFCCFKSQWAYLHIKIELFPPHWTNLIKFLH